MHFSLPIKVALLLLYQVLFTFALTVKSTRTRRLFFPPIATISLYLGLSPLRTGLPFPVDYLLCCTQLGNVVIASDFLLIKDVHKDLQMKGQTASPATLPFFARLEWATHLLNSPRFIGWAQEPSKALPPRWREHQRTNSIKKFSLDQLVRLTLYVVLFWLAAIYTPRYRLGDGKDLFGIPLTALGRRGMGILLGLIPIFTFFDGGHRFASLIFVLCRKWQPKDWIPLFGSWLEAYTLRRFWGQTWHQTLRKYTSSHGSFMAKRVFCLEKKTYVYYIVQIFIAFLISAAIHITADLIFFGKGSGAVYFFLSQPAGVVFEDIIARTIGASTRWNLIDPVIRRFLGYLWVLTWFILTTPLWKILFVDSNTVN
ncbi:Membrane bound O-acyl transferase family domain containing protein [Amanita muscaria]